MDSDNTLDKIRDIIVETVHPDKIILFGSRATGKNRKDSDYDIFILKSGIENKRVVTRAIYRALLDIEIGTSVDILASSPEKFERNKSNPYLITSDVNTHGITIYVNDYKEWINRAKSCLTIAKSYIDENVYLEDLCFNAQQSVEKA